MVVKIVFSWASQGAGSGGTGGAHNIATRTCNALNGTYGYHCYMRNPNDATWWQDWKAEAQAADIVIKWRDAKYGTSDACQKENNFCNTTGKRQAFLDYEGMTAAQCVDAIKSIC